MFLKTIEIQGFKSFPDKTVLTFGKGLTAVVGPNGSGKSNISDAIRWVLGEQSGKALRSGKSEDVIFNGSSARKSLGFAEVSLTIDNADRALEADTDEVKVTRRYYRSGESEYLLNGTRVRLEDIRLLFMDTGLGRDGYSIIGQGRVGDIIASKSEDRREIFEEAAGIAKYRHRKNKAERRLAAAEDNLVRLRDILRELEERVGPLEKQAEKAKLFLEYAGEKKGLEIGLWMNTVNRTRDVLRDLNAKLELARTQYDAAGEGIDAIDEQLEQLAQESLRLEGQAEEVRRTARSIEEQALRKDGDAELVENDRQHLAENVARLHREQEQLEAGNSAIDEEIASRQSAIEEKQRQIEGAEHQREALMQELASLSRHNAAFSDRIEELSQAAAQQAMALADQRVLAVTAESALNELSARLEQITVQQEEYRTARESLEAELSACQKDHERVSDQITALQNTLRGYELRLRNRTEKWEEARAAAEKLRLETDQKAGRVRLLEEMERQMEGFSQSVRDVIRQADRGALRGLHGPVSRLLKVSADTALAIETALGAAAQNIVCDSEDDAKQAIAYLQKNKAGRATFLPLTSVRGNPLTENGIEKEDGFVGRAAELVTFDAAYRGVVESLLGHTVVVTDIDDAVAMARRHRFRFRIVTLDGQVVNAGGSMTGGSSVKGAGMLSRRAEIERLTADVEALSAKAEAAAQRSRECQQELAAVQAEMSGSQGELATAQEDRIRLEGEQRRLEELVGNHTRALDALTAESDTLNTRREQNLAQQQQAKQKADEILQQKEQTEAELEKLAGDRREQLEKYDGMSAQASEWQLSVVGWNKEIEALTQVIEELRHRQGDQAASREQLAQELVKLAEQDEALSRQAQQLRIEAAALRESVRNTEQTVADILQKRQENDRLAAEWRQKTRDKADERENAAREAARLEEKCTSAQAEENNILHRLFEEYGLTRNEAAEQFAPPEDIPAASRRLTELKNKIRALGSVNTDAVEEYREVSERYTFLKEQIADVEQSRAELLKLNNELTAEMRDIFARKFEEINWHFGRVFTEMFGGGKAELSLTDPEDVLSSGIEIRVQPPGKVILNLAVLSGGEKALVAIVLLFAILKVSPSPFCVLDELEAALDDVNVDRYAAYLRRMTDKTQFIVITHRRGTMEEADVLYGVTMQERGVSKLLELRASEVELALGIDGKKQETP